MDITRRKLTQAAIVAGAFGSFLKPSMAQSLETAKIINGFPGSSIDALCRIVAEKLRNVYARNLYVENKTGIGGQIAAAAVKNSAPDGSSILLTPMTVLGVYPHTYKQLPYDPVGDFVPVSTAVTYNYALAVGKEVPASVTNVGQLMEWFKSNPSRASFGTGATGSTLHFTGILLGRAAGVELSHVGYSNGQNMITDLAGGNLPASIGSMGSLLPLHKSGRIRIIATSGEKRSRFLPQVGTFTEAGFKDMAFREWYGFFLPARTSPELVNQLNSALKTVLASQDVVDALALHALEVNHSTPAELAALLKADSELWGVRVKSVGFKQDS